MLTLDSVIFPSISAFKPASSFLIEINGLIWIFFLSSKVLAIPRKKADSLAEVYALRPTSLAATLVTSGPLP
ncbi:hypothetical protein D3C87_1821770 [compost metagenome]